MTERGGDGSPTGSLAKSDAMIVKSPGGGGDSPPSTLKPGQATVGAGNAVARGDAGGFLLLGSGQVLLGVAMAVLGAMALVHEAAMSGAGAGLWGGAVAMAAGAVGLAAGLRGCYSPRGRVPPAFAAAFLALCLVAVAVANLVVVLTVTGIIRDGHKPDEHITVQEEGAEARQVIQLNWAHIATNCGLLVASFSECVLAVASGYRSYRRVCPCSRRHHRGSPEPSESFYSTASKELLVSSWLGHSPPSTLGTLRRPDSGVLLVPPHQLPQPVYVFPPPPPPHPSSMKSYLPNAAGGRYINPMGQPRYAMRTPPHLHHLIVRGGRKKRDHEERHRRRRRESRDVSRASPEKERQVTEEDVAKTYTGMDREIAEEFIAIAMDPGAVRNKHANSSSEDTATTSDHSDKRVPCR